MKTVSHVSLFILVLSLFAISSGCKKNDNPNNSNRPGVVFNDVKVIASLQGKVMDENNSPAVNAIVRSGNNSTTTDANGVFYFKNIELGKNAGTVSVEKSGYFKTNRTFITNPGSVNYVEIQLIPKTDKGSFSSLSGGTINIDNGSSVTFAANSIVNSATNSLYSGNVKVKGKYLDPEDPALTAIMPGNLTGIDTTKQLKLLKTYGMIAIELEGSAAEKLNIAPGQTATITMPIAASMVADAPERIPLWFFNDTTGLWIEQGFANKQGSNYVGTVSHFTFWNCDRPFKLVDLKITFKNQTGTSLRFYRVELTNTQNNSSSIGYTDSSGVVIGGVPLNVALQMKVYDRCWNVIGTQIVGPFSSSTDLGTVIVNTSPAADIKITGSAVNCSGNPVTYGYVSIKIEGLIYATTISNGNFSTTILNCNSAPTDIQVNAIDLDDNQIKDTILSAVTGGNYSTGTIKVCGKTFEEYVKYLIGGTSLNFATGLFMTTYRNGDVTYISSKSPASDVATSFQFSGAASPGDYALDSVMIISNKAYYAVTPITVAITEYGNVGGYITGSFSGNLTNSENNTIDPFSCNFRVRRQQ